MAIRPKYRQVINNNFEVWTPTCDLKVVVSLATGRFPKREFDTMVLSISQRAQYTQKAPKIMKMMNES